MPAPEGFPPHAPKPGIVRLGTGILVAGATALAPFIAEAESGPPARARRQCVDEGGLSPLAPSLLEFTGGEDSGRPAVRGRYVDDGGLESTPRSAIGPDDAASVRRVSRPNDEQVVVHPSYLPLAKVAWEDSARGAPTRRQAHDEGGLESVSRSPIGPDECGPQRSRGRFLDDTWSPKPLVQPLFEFVGGDDSGRPVIRGRFVDEGGLNAPPRSAIGPDDARGSRAGVRPRDDDWAQKPLVITALREFLSDDDARAPIGRRQRPDESWSLKPFVSTALLEFIGAEDTRAPSRRTRARDDEWSQPSARPFLFADDVRTRRPVSRPLDDPWSPRSTPPFLFVEDVQSRPQSRRPRADESWLERLPVATLGTFIGAEDYAPRKRAARLDDWSHGPTFPVQVQLGPGVYAPPQTSLMPTAPPQAPLYALATTCTPLDQAPPKTLSRFASGQEDAPPPKPRLRPPEDSERFL